MSTEWKVEIYGDEEDLKLVANSFNDQRFMISEVDGRFMLSSTEFDGIKDTQRIRKIADKIVEYIQGSFNLLMGYRSKFYCGNVWNRTSKGSWGITVFADPAVVKGGVSYFSVQIDHQNGTIETHYPLDQALSWLRSSLNDDVVRRILKLYALGDLNWVDLYRVYEIIKADVGGKQNIINNGWCKKTEIELFKQTANHPEASGNDSRHGHNKEVPPRDPMTIQEARSLIKRLTLYWLKSRTCFNGRTIQQ